ncbi:MAG TPA: CdaR family protein [Terriglobales bacterium]|nr:CdaR family protein [Terriglobales bacterium]
MANLFRRVFIQDLGLKAVSLALAFGLWLVMVRSPIAEVEMRVPIEFHNIPEALEIDSASFTEAQVRVRGTERVIHRLRAGEVRVEVDLSSVHAGTRTFDLTSRNIRLPQDLEVVQIIPGQFQLSFDTRMTRTVPVHPRVIGIPAETPLEADPATIIITGPRRRVEGVDAATTDPVDATGVMTRATFVTQAYVSDPLIQVVHPTPIRVTVIMERLGGDKKTQ